MAILITITQAQNKISSIDISGNRIGPWIYVGLVAILSVILIFIIQRFSKGYKQSYDNISYLTRKIDG